MAEYCVNCGHGWTEHHTIASTPVDADGKSNLPFGSVIPCDMVMWDGSSCGCSRYFGRIMTYSVWMVDWSSATSRGNDKVTFPDHLTRAQMISRWESAHLGCYVDKLQSCGTAEVA
jgi:hypothetical protein